ncbi:hypothetical protein PV332_10540 [Streptomyces scabiei]|uniref:hypothetical protein n=1 Tax=Streptomyces scabiei TaxID=1930 RepID=UPI0029AE9D64|nr:hypothetical protein [Streptomyces scabiei]MDX2575918.1 hypothetical protein [Streptomyces scabiei]MDX2885609.1 hypothetical protein [Streptomyces scabiei]MDX2993438.1 hypothetical protein [Streptomyces scabiei]MDX3028448.1 hypothetical protein [Streptomyces scabiei]MDX3047218.1 hypothetical protein [Streptomyces scabiei]
MTSTTKDARGIEIVEGATCVYGAGVGRSIALVEAVVDGFTDSGRVWLKVVRRSYGATTWGKPRDRVHVGPDRLVIVDALPSCDLPTDAEKAAESRQERMARYRERIAAFEADEEPEEWERKSNVTVEDYRGWLADLERR